jgi:hypothetical protein
MPRGGPGARRPAGLPPPAGRGLARALARLFRRAARGGGSRRRGAGGDGGWVRGGGRGGCVGGGGGGVGARRQGRGKAAQGKWARIDHARRRPPARPGSSRRPVWRVGLRGLRPKRSAGSCWSASGWPTALSGPAAPPPQARQRSLRLCGTRRRPPSAPRSAAAPARSSLPPVRRCARPPRPESAAAVSPLGGTPIGSLPSHVPPPLAGRSGVHPPAGTGAGSSRQRQPTRPPKLHSRVAAARSPARLIASVVPQPEAVADRPPSYRRHLSGRARPEAQAPHRPRRISTLSRLVAFGRPVHN